MGDGEHRFLTADSRAEIDRAYRSLTPAQKKEVRGKDWSPSNLRKIIYRVRNPGESIGLDNLDKLIRRMNAVLPSPIRPVFERLDYKGATEWIALGRRLSAADESELASITEQVRKVVEGLEAKKRLR